MSLSRLPLMLLALLSAVPAAAQYRTKFPLDPAVFTDTLGVNIHFTDPKPGEMEQLAAGFHWIRMDLSWEGIERERGKYDFSAFDSLMASLKANGAIRPIFILDYGNPLYGSGSPRTPEARAAFARFAAASVTHFRHQGVLWEMWNEPNGTFWNPRANVDEYIALALETGKAIRQAAPDEYYVGAGVSGMDFPFMERCFQAGLLQYWDAVSFHPYRDVAPETATPDFQRVREMIARYGPKGKTVPILSSEWGYSELYPTLNLEKQSKYIAREFLSDAMNGLPVSIWYDWHDDGTDPKETEHHFGTVFNDYKPKPTYQAVQTVATTLRGFRYNKRLALDSPDDYCLLFDNGKGEARLAVWTTNPKPHEAILPANGGKFAVIGFTGEGSEATATGEGLRVMLTDAPQYLVPQNEARLAYQAAIAWNPLPPYLMVNDVADVSRQLAALKAGSQDNLGSPFQGRLRLDLAASKNRPAQTFVVWFSYVERNIAPPSLNLPFDFNPYAEQPTRLRVTFTNTARPETFSQETLLVARHPLRLTVQPAIGRTLTVEIANPSGEPFAGGLRLRCAGSANTETDQTQKVRIAKGETQGSVHFDLSAFPDGPYTAQATLLGPAADKTARPFLTSPELRFTPCENFAVNNDYRLAADGDPKVKSASTLTFGEAPEKLHGLSVRAAKISYEFDAGWKFLRLAANHAAPTTWAGQPTKLGMWVFADNSGAILRTRFMDATGQTFQSGAAPSERMEWKGWRYLTFSLKGSGSGHWGGANDGVVHYPIHPDTLLLVDSPNQLKQAGSLSVAGVTLIEEGN